MSAMHRALQAAARGVKLLIGRANVELVSDGTTMQSAQISLLEDETRDKVERFQNYGFTGVPDPGAEGIALAVGADRDHVVLVAVDDRRYRKSGLLPGEVCVYTKWGDVVLLKEGEIEVRHATKVTVVAPNIQLTGNVNVTGSVTVSGTVNAAGQITGAGKNLSTHVHSGVQVGGGNTGAPV